MTATAEARAEQVVPEPTEAPAPRRSTTLRAYLEPYRARLAVGVGMLFLTNVLDKSVPWVLKNAVDALRAGRYAAVSRYAIVALGLAAVMWGVRSRSRTAVFNVGRDVEFDLRNDLLGQIHRLGPAFLRRMATGDVMSRATNDLGQVRMLVGFGLLNAVNSVFAYTGAIGLMLVISPELTAWALLPYPLFLLMTRAFSRALFVRSQEAQRALGALADRAQENLAGVRVVRAFALEAREEERFSEANRAALEKNMRLVVLRGLMWPMLMLIAALGTLIVVWRGGGMVLERRLTPGEFAAFTAYLGQLVWPTLALGYLLGILQRGRASFERVREVLDSTPEIVAPENARVAGRRGDVVVRHLTFEREGRKLLDDVGFELPAGRSLAVVGEIGSGKSTLAALLPRLLPVPAGAVFLDDTDVTRLDLRSLRHAVGYAQQDPFLFSTTIERNIGFALDDPNAKDAHAKIRAAAKEAAILDEIEGLPEGFDTVVGERGVQLSGGQKQRISLARALIREPRVLVLDDPMSAVDARTESRILEAIDRAGQGRTLVLVTHRVVAARRMDEIIVLEHGRIVERGTHDQLVARGGRYARMAEQQELEEELGRL